MKIIGTVVGGDAVVRKLRALPGDADQALFDVTQKLTFDLQAYVKSQKLSGRPPGALNTVTDRLRSSINSKVQRHGTAIVGTVGTNVVYAAIHEFGGVIYPKNALALHFQIDGHWIFAKKVTMPERSFLRSSLAENKENIVSSFARTVQLLAKRFGK